MTDHTLANKIPQLFGGLLLLMGIGAIASSSAALSQEPDTPAILRAAFRLKLTRSDVVMVNRDPQRLLIRNTDDLNHHLKDQGWVWVDQLGANSTYRQNDQTLNVTCGMYSQHFMICDLSHD